MLLQFLGSYGSRRLFNNINKWKKTVVIKLHLLIVPNIPESKSFRPIIIVFNLISSFNFRKKNHNTFVWASLSYFFKAQWPFSPSDSLELNPFLRVQFFFAQTIKLLPSLSEWQKENPVGWEPVPTGFKRTVSESFRSVCQPPRTVSQLF